MDTFFHKSAISDNLQKLNQMINKKAMGLDRSTDFS